MGMYASGEIYYGVSFGEADPRWPMGEYGYREQPDDWSDDDDDWDAWLMKLAGWGNPYGAQFPPGHPEPDYSLTREQRDAKYLAETEVWEEVHSDWRQYADDYRAAQKEIVQACPVEILRLGYENGSKAVAVRGTHLSHAWDGEPIPKGHFHLSQARIDEATAWCEKHGIYFENPAWILGGSYG